MNFGQIKAQVKSFLNRDDLDSYIPIFINIAKSKIELEYNLYYMLNSTNLTLTEGVNTLSVPSDFKTVFSLAILDPTLSYYRLIYPCFLDYLVYLQLNKYTQSGEPLYYSIAENKFHFTPTPDKNYSVELKYYKYSPDLSADTDTNWLTENAWFVLLYGALLEFEPYLMNDERMVTWKALYDDAIRKVLLADLEYNSPRPWIIINGAKPI